METEKISPEETLRRYRIARSQRKTFADKEEELQEKLKDAGLWFTEGDEQTEHRHGEEVLVLTPATYKSLDKTKLLKALVNSFGQEELVNAGIVDVNDDLALVLDSEFYSVTKKPRLVELYREDTEPVEINVDQELVELAERESSSKRVPKHDE